MTNVLKTSSRAISEAASALIGGGIIIVPTGRWYMVCTKADNYEAIKRIFEAKKRPLTKQPLFVLPRKSLTKSYFKLTSEASKLIGNLWPGDLSLLLSWTDTGVSSQFKAIDQTHALTNNPPGAFGKIARAANTPLAATTVNVSGPFSDKQGPAITVGEAINFIQSSALKVDLVIDGGISQAFNHSTILDCRTTSQRPVIVREGYVHKRAINAALGYELF